MKTIGIIAGTIILIAILIGAFIYLQEPPEINQEEGIREPQIKDWIINMDYQISDGSVSTMVALPVECYKGGVRNNNNKDREYISNSADYIVNVKVDNIEIKEGERTFIFEFINFEKEELDYVPQTIKITNAYNPGIEDDSPFQKFEEDKYYKLFLEESDGEIDFICHMEGIEEIYPY